MTLFHDSGSETFDFTRVFPLFYFKISMINYLLMSELQKYAISILLRTNPN